MRDCIRDYMENKRINKNLKFRIKQIFYYRALIRQVVLITLFVGIGFIPLRAQYADLPDVVTKVATTSGNWLKIETGARGLGMGGAQVAAGMGVSGIPYNPASVAFIEGSEAYYGKSNYLAGISHNVLAYGTRFTGSDYVGIHLFYLDSGPMEVTNIYYPDGTGENFHVTNLALKLTYARRLTDRLKVGGTATYIRDEIYTTMMQSVAVDIGSNFDTGIYGFVLGMSVSNFGPEVRFGGEGLQQTVPDTLNVDKRLAKVTESFPLPLMFRLGIRNELLGPGSEFIQSADHRLTVAVDGTNPIDYVVTGNLGLEYAWHELAFLRLGTHLGHDTAKMTAGGGLRYRMGRTELGVDYAFVDYGILNTTHQIGLSVQF